MSVSRFTRRPDDGQLSIGVGGYDVVLQRVGDIKRNGVVMTDDAGLVGEGVMQDIINDYRISAVPNQTFTMLAVVVFHESFL